MSWVAPMVTLYDGTQVASDSRQWAEECEARQVLAMSLSDRSAFLETILKFRKHAGLESLKARCYALEPYYVLSLPDKGARNAYAARVEARFGTGARVALEGKVRAIWKERQAIAAEGQTVA